MEEVIFNGTDVHKRLNMAEVSLFLDNTQRKIPLEYEEIKITRRLFRSGESEYFINQVPARLKDVTELFMDTGMNPNAYSIMEQENVDFLMNARPEERRIVFEEAAGVTKYKSRKQEARVKLEHVSQNLVRLEDIIGELKHQLGSLKYQVRKAQQYQKYKKQLEASQINLLVHRLTDLGRNLKSLEEKDREVLNKIQTSSRVIAQKEKSLQRDKLSREELDKRRAVFQSRQFEISAQIDLSRQLIDNLNQREKELETGWQQRESQIKDLKVRNLDYEKNLLREEKEWGKLEKQIASQQKEMQEKERQVLALEATLKGKKRELEKKENALDGLNTKISELLARLTHFEVEKKLRLENREKLRLEIGATEKGGQTGRKLAPEADEWTIQWVLQQRISGVCGRLEGLIEIPEKYQKSLRSVLSYRLHSLVVENSEIGWDLVEKLRRTKKGRIFIFPLDMVGLQTETEIETEGGVKAGEVVKYSEKYGRLIRYLLRGVVIVEKLPSGPLRQQQVCFVDLDGNIIYSSGEIYGGGEREIPRVEQEETLTAELEKNERQIKQFSEKIHFLESKKRELKDGLELAKQKVFSLTEEKHSLQEEITNLKISISAEEGKLANKKFLRDRNRQIFSDAQGAIKRLEGELKNLSAARDKAREDKANEEKKVKERAEEKVQIEKHFQRDEEKSSVLSRKIAEQQEEIFGQRHKLEEEQAEHQQYEVEAAGWRAKLEEVEAELSREYGLAPEEAIKTYPPQEVPPEGIEGLKKKLASFGEVNLAAPEEYRRLQEREEFLEQQRDDLIKAQEELNKLIDKIDTTICRQFKDNFLKVKKNFGDIFKKLFEGGEADLILTRENDLLETGVDIVAQPPGKRLQNILLLSQGEKVLTAISLLFALFMVKPSPLCLLDEVDAALDEANLRRFTRMFKEFTNNSQFIIVTHSKATMEICDVLYGVTMEEPGVSKIVSVKLRKEQ